MFLATTNVLGNPQVVVTQTTTDWAAFLGTTASSPPMMRAGTRITAYDRVYGTAEFILAYGVASLAIGDMVVIGAGYATTRTVAASRGMLAVSMAANTSTSALSWFCIWGQVPGTVATHTAAVSYLTATAGSVSSTDGGVGYGIAGCSAVVAASGTVTTKSVTTTNGGYNLIVPDTDGLYVGMAVTGTGIAASSTISAIGQGGTMLGAPTGVASNDRNVVVLNNAMTASGTVTGTFAHPSTKATLQLNYPAAVGTLD